MTIKLSRQEKLIINSFLLDQVNDLFTVYENGEIDADRLIDSYGILTEGMFIVVHEKDEHIPQIVFNPTDTTGN